jgi:hypothetical protein
VIRAPRIACVLALALAAGSALAASAPKTAPPPAPARDPLATPLDKYGHLPPQQQDAAYLPTRCAALYVAVLEYAGRSLDPDQRSSFETESSAFALSAMQVRAQQRGGSPPDYADEVYGVVKALAATYVERMKNNQAKSGQAFMNDGLLKGDIEFCKKLAVLVTPPDKKTP